MLPRSITVLVSVVLAAIVLTLPAAGQPTPRVTDRAVEVRVIEHDEFRWGDAAVGALAGFGLAALLAGVIAATDRKRRSDP